jgi:hypothetical protein
VRGAPRSPRLGPEEERQIAGVRIIRPLLAVLLLAIGLACVPAAWPQGVDLTGEWVWTNVTTSGQPFEGTATIVHDVDAGTMTWAWRDGYAGTGTVTGSSFAINAATTGLTATLTGQIDSSDHLSGTWSQSDGESGTFTATRIGQAPTPTPTPTPPSPSPPAPPTAPPRDGAGGKEEAPPAGTVLTRPVSGRVLVRGPGSKRFEELVAGRAIRAGTTVDTSQGRVAVRSRTRSDGAPDGGSGEFFGGRFLLAKAGTTTAPPDLRLQGSDPCKAGAAAKRRRKKKRLWGDVSGRFHVTGRYGNAINSGTRWLTEDRCRATRFRVVKGTIHVQRNGESRRVTVKAPRDYVVRARR